MREIKFRVWGGSQMIFPTEIYGDIRDEYAMSLSGVLMYFVESGNGNYCPSTLEARFKRDFIVMQFTGLHDKNNNPIYEGDFVKIVVPGFSEGDENFIIEGVVSFVDHGWNVVKSNKGKFDFNSNYYFGRIVDHPFEIIGNIYESPLIK